MKASSKARIFSWTLVVGAALVLGTVILPELSVPQQLTLSGQQRPTNETTYQLNGILIPPISKGQEIIIKATGYNPSSVLITLYTQDNNRFGFPILSVLPQTVNYTEVGNSPETQAYVLVITSFNGTGYQVTLTSVWSPFYILRSYLAESILVLSIGLAGTYYFRGIAKREEMESLALARAQ
jgi:hypothetical protein